MAHCRSVAGLIGTGEADGEVGIGLDGSGGFVLSITKRHPSTTKRQRQAEFQGAAGLGFRVNRGANGILLPDSFGYALLNHQLLSC
jgi:hypothetical protein